jgi:ABC-type sugar transport system ATPase subunit
VTHDQVEAMTLGDKVVVMRDGHIHQVGSPGTIYAQPADTFVATFIGSPEMNLFAGRVLREGESFRFDAHGFSLKLEGLEKPLAEGEAQLGVRAEDIEVGNPETASLQAEVDMVNDLGSDKYIQARVGEEPVTLRALKEARFVKPGAIIGLNLDPARMHFFRSGRRV